MHACMFLFVCALAMGAPNKLRISEYEATQLAFEIIVRGGDGGDGDDVSPAAESESTGSTKMDWVAALTGTKTEALVVDVNVALLRAFDDRTDAEEEKGGSAGGQIRAHAQVG